MKILVTGSRLYWFCTFNELLNRGDIVVGIDNHNDYYDPKLKEARIARHQNLKIIHTQKLTLKIKLRLQNL